jgi:hypothetical protein
MAKIELGNIQIKSAKDVWKHEEKDFTPWLAENIDHLSKLIGIPIAVEQTEKRVGAYELDIFGRVEGSDAIVIVENQLDPTDHKHLGQLITYAAGLEAAIVIWIAPEVGDDHRSAIKWLNRNMSEKVSFFLVRPEVIQVDNSKPAVRFQLEAAPSEFEKRLRESVEDESAPRFEFRRKFWEDLFAYLAANGHPWAQGRRTTKEGWISSSVGTSGIAVNVSMAQGSRIRVEIWMRDDADKQIFEALLAKKAEIEKRLEGETVSWERLDDSRASRVAVYRNYDKEQAANDTPQRKEIFSWIGTQLSAMREIAKKYLVSKS